MSIDSLDKNSAVVLLSAMLNRIVVVLFVCFFIGPNPAFSITGNDWNGIGKERQDFYIMGWIDSLNAARDLCSEMDKINKIDCEFIEVQILSVALF